jgi:hypothetical protein
MFVSGKGGSIMRSGTRFIFFVFAAAASLMIPALSGAGEAPYNPQPQNAASGGQCSSQQMEMVNGHCTWKCMGGHVRDASGACVCPAGTMQGQSNGLCERAGQACPAGQARNGAGACAAAQKCEGGREWDAEKGNASRHEQGVNSAMLVRSGRR